MRTGIVIGDLRVQAMVHAGGRRSAVVWPDGTVHEEADGFLRLSEGTGTQKTYAYYLVDHLRWREREGLTTESATLRDLHRYMGAVGARVATPYGQPWRTPPKRPYGAAALGVAAACLKGFYLHRCAFGVNPGLGEGPRIAAPTHPDRPGSGHAGAREDLGAGQPAGAAAWRAAPTSEDAARGCPFTAPGGGEHGPRPVGRDLAGRQRAAHW